MNNFFNPKRFGRLFIKHTAEHYRTYLMSVGVLAGVMLLGGAFLFYVIPEPPDPGMQTGIFITLMLIAGSIFTSTVFGDYGIKNRAIPALTLPASSFEKYLVGWLYSYPIFIAVYTLVFYLVLWGLSSTRQWPGQHFQAMDLAQPDMYMLPVLYTFLHSLTIFGAIFFEKLQFIKTGFAFFIGYAATILLNTLFFEAITGEGVKAAVPFGYLNFNKQNKFYSIAASGPATLWIPLAMITAAILIWVAAYFKLKEKQV
jgi:hypothetical protein